MNDATAVISNPAEPGAALEEDVTTTLYRAAIGAVRTDYYLSRFARFEAADRSGPSWNWTACLCTLNWLLYRKLWSAALGYTGALVGLLLLGFGIGGLVLQFSDASEIAMLVVFAALAFVVPGVYANALFYKDCRKKMAAALAASDELPKACAMLASGASTRKRMIWQLLANVVLAALAVGAYLGFMELNTLAHPLQHAETASTTAKKGATLPIADMPATPASAAASATASVVAPAASAALPVLAASAPVTPASAAVVAAVAAVSPASAPLPAASSPPPEAKPASVAALAPPAKATARSKTPAIAHPYFVSVGLFAVESNAANAHAKLLAAGLPSQTKVLHSTKGPLTRVRVGPYETRKQAQTAVEKIQGLQLDAFIVEP